MSYYIQCCLYQPRKTFTARYLPFSSFSLPSSTVTTSNQQFLATVMIYQSTFSRYNTQIKVSAKMLHLALAWAFTHPNVLKSQGSSSEGRFLHFLLDVDVKKCSCILHGNFFFEYCRSFNITLQLRMPWPRASTGTAGRQTDVPSSQLGTDPEPTKVSGKMVFDSGEVWIRSLWKNILAVNYTQRNSIYRGVK